MSEIIRREGYFVKELIFVLAWAITSRVLVDKQIWQPKLITV